MRMNRSASFGFFATVAASSARDFTNATICSSVTDSDFAPSAAISSAVSRTSRRCAGASSRMDLSHL